MKLEASRGPSWHRKGPLRPLESKSRPEKPWMQLVFPSRRAWHLPFGEMGKAWDSFPGAPCGGHNRHRTEGSAETDDTAEAHGKLDVTTCKWWFYRRWMGRFTGMQNLRIFAWRISYLRHVFACEMTRWIDRFHISEHTVATCPIHFYKVW